LVFCKFHQFLAMGACYHTDSHSDAFSSNFFLPPNVLSWKIKIKIKIAELGPNFGHYSLRPESLNIALKTLTIPCNFRSVLGNFICFSDSGEEMKGLSLRPPQQKRKLGIRKTFEQFAYFEHEMTHEFMSNKSDNKGNYDFALEPHHEFMSLVSQQ
jgi:hypothetical protein